MARKPNYDKLIMLGRVRLSLAKPLSPKIIAPSAAPTRSPAVDAEIGGIALRRGHSQAGSAWENIGNAAGRSRRRRNQGAVTDSHRLILAQRENEGMKKALVRKWRKELERKGE